MKLVVFSDLHLDWTTNGVSRFEELRETLLGPVLEAASRADVAMFLGDLCDPDSGPVIFRAVQTVMLFARTLADRGVPSLWIAGNHDVIEDGSGCTTLTPMTALASDLVRVLERPSMIEIGGVNFVALPYAPTCRTYDPEAFVRNVDLRKRKSVVAGHLTIPGVVPGEEVTEMPRGRDVLYPIEAARSATLQLNGHYHRRQQTESGIWIPGSLARLTFGEADNRPGFLEVEI